MPDITFPEYAQSIRSVLDSVIATGEVVLSTLQIDQRSAARGFIAGSLQFYDRAVLHFREFIDMTQDEPKVMYAYHYQDADNNLIFRYDNASHRPALSQPSHKHITPLPVRLWRGQIREPDVLFMAKEHSDRIGEQFFGPPDLVAEVISPSTRRTDRVDKFYEYAEAGIPEYWILESDARTVEVFVLRAGAYEPLGKWGLGETARSELLAGFQVSVASLFPG
jgi:hypothetical protein